MIKYKHNTEDLRASIQMIKTQVSPHKRILEIWAIQEGALRPEPVQEGRGGGGGGGGVWFIKTTMIARRTSYQMNC